MPTDEQTTQTTEATGTSETTEATGASETHHVDGAAHHVTGEIIDGIGGVNTVAVEASHKTPSESFTADGQVELPNIGAGSSGFLGHSHFGSYGVSGGDDYFAVKTEVLRATAESGRAAIKELSELIQSIREMVAASDQYWTGEAAEEFRERVPIGLKDFERCLEDVSEYPRELISYADKHEGVITETELIASDVEMPVYSEA